MPSGIRPDWKKLSNKWNKTAIDFSVGTVRELADDPDPTTGTTSVLPGGGEEGQVLTKDSAVSYDASWQTPITGLRYATLVKFGV
jgi:hypothetical protein